MFQNGKIIYDIQQPLQHNGLIYTSVVESKLNLCGLKRPNVVGFVE